MSTRNRFAPAALAAALALAAAVPAAATNGMYLIGYGPETVGRGGANIAVSDRTLAVNFNPAGIVQLQGNHTAVSISTLAPSLTFGNAANRTFDAQDRYFLLPAFTYVRASKDSPWSWGFGMVAQGGMGATFEGENTFFGTRDETFTEVRFATMTPTVAYSFSDDMALGLTANVGYADASFRFFPDTSYFNPDNPAMSFPGLNLKQAGGLQTNLRLGWWWRPDPRFSLGAIYQTETRSHYDNGDLWVNFESFPGLGRKVLYSADVDGFTFASQAGVGVAFRPQRQWVVALDVKRYFWDSAIDTIEVRASNPDTAGAPPTLEIPFVFDWRDQWIVALGADFRATDRLTLRAGYNFGQNPVPDRTLTPLFPATTERHLTAGFGWLVGNQLVEMAVERAFGNTRTNDNPDPTVNPFGPGATVSHEQWTVSFGVSWAWARKG
jgi:long-chain fatty acid transport protein